MFDSRRPTRSSLIIICCYLNVTTYFLCHHFVTSLLQSLANLSLNKRMLCMRFAVPTEAYSIFLVEFNFAIGN